MKTPIEIDEDTMARIDSDYPEHAYISCSEGISNSGFNRCPRCTETELALLTAVSARLDVAETEADQVKAELLRIVSELRRALLFYKNNLTKELPCGTNKQLFALNDPRYTPTGATKTHTLFRATKKVAADALAKLDKQLKGRAK